MQGHTILKLLVNPFRSNIQCQHTRAQPISSNPCRNHRFCWSKPIICSDCPRRTLIIMANYSQNPSNKSSNVYVIIELVLRTTGQQGTPRNCFCTDHKTRFAISYTSQAHDRFNTTNVICHSHLLSYTLPPRCHLFTSQIITILKHIEI
jgi:hypothetical protein